jgi:hypothetical protein
MTNDSSEHLELIGAAELAPLNRRSADLPSLLWSKSYQIFATDAL